MYLFDQIFYSIMFRMSLCDLETSLLYLTLLDLLALQAMKIRSKIKNLARCFPTLKATIQILITKAKFQKLSK